VVLRVGVLGPVTAWYGHEELRVGQPRQQAVLGILAMRANRVISRGELVDAVWGQDPPASAEGGIYTYVAGLRRVIEPTRSARGPGRVLVSSGAGYVLHLVPGQPDAVAFEQQVARARQLRKNGDPVAAVDALEGALGLWRGVAFAGVPGPFAETERVRLAELRSGAAEERADVLLGLGRHEEVVPDLTALVADHPLRERMRGLLMIALYRGGRHAEALRVFADGRHVLAEELGIDPGTELSRIHQQVLTCDPALNLAADATRDGHPDQASGSARPRPQAAGTGSRGSDEPVLPLPAQLPLDAQGFSGRHDELRTLHDMLPSARAGETVSYRGAGTVEFLLDATAKDFMFLEMNTRIQVEHPITEMVTGIDLVEQQFLVAAGQPPSFDPDAISPAGHALELRIYAEDPVRFLPGPGQITQWEEPSGPGVRVDAGYQAGNTVTPFYDPLLAKLCVHGATRAEALSLARSAVADFRVAGPKTNLPFHAELLDNPEFVSGDYDTGLVSRMRQS